MLTSCIYARATFLDLVGHPQALQENRSKSCLVFLHCGIPHAYKLYICQGDMFGPSRSSSGPPRKQIKELFSFSALWVTKCLQVLYTRESQLKTLKISTQFILQYNI